MNGDRLSLLHQVADAVADALAAVTDWGGSGVRSGQYAADVLVDTAALRVLDAAGVGVLSEESGELRLDRAEVVVIDPLDGSTNASRGIPWCATSLCVVDGDGPAVALVADQSHLVRGGGRARGSRWWAVRGEGAWRDGVAVNASRGVSLADAIVGVSGPAPPAPGWAQYRALGACALDLCLVASGVLDGYMDCGRNQHGVWDYLAGALICQEAGAVVSDAAGRELLTLRHADRRTPLAAANTDLHAALGEVRSRLPL